MCFFLLQIHDLVGALAWNGDMLSSGSRDRLILQRDIRTPNSTPERKLIGHKQEVCLDIFGNHLFNFQTIRERKIECLSVAAIQTDVIV